MLQGWATLPRNVLDQVLVTISAADCWKARQVCSNWAHAARRSACFEVAINVDTRSLFSKVRALTPRQRSVPNVRVMFHLAQPVYLADAAGLLQRLPNKVTLVGAGRYDPCIIMLFLWLCSFCL